MSELDRSFRCSDESETDEDSKIPEDSDRYKLGPKEAKWLWMPLPPDLPIYEKDVLTQMAAYEGNVDRYVRLRHPRRIRSDYEFYCIIRGIHHNTMFARCWADQLKTNPDRIVVPGSTMEDSNWIQCDHIRTAINARRIMVSDIDGIVDGSECFPWLIWWPIMPHCNALDSLAKQGSRMHTQVAIACILSDNLSLYKKINPRPCASLFEMASRSTEPFYLEDLRKRAEEDGVEFEYLGGMDSTEATLRRDLEPSCDVISGRLHQGAFSDGYHYVGIYETIQPHSDLVERYVWLSEEAVRIIMEECDGYYHGADISYLHQ